MGLRVGPARRLHRLHLHDDQHLGSGPPLRVGHVLDYWDKCSCRGRCPRTVRAARDRALGHR